MLLYNTITNNKNLPSLLICAHPASATVRVTPLLSTHVVDTQSALKSRACVNEDTILKCIVLHSACLNPFR